MWGKNDVESSASEPLYPAMEESPELRWSFIRKIYGIVSIQLLLIVAVASVFVYVHPVTLFLTTTWAGRALFVVSLITPFIVVCLLFCYHKKHPVNYILYGVLTLALLFVLGYCCTFTVGKYILEAFMLTATLVVSLIVYTFWAAKRGHGFNFLKPYMCGALSILTVFVCIQIWFPLGNIGQMLYVLVGALLTCVYIIYDTENLIKRYTYDEYIWAAMMLYLDVVYLFLVFFTPFSSARDEKEVDDNRL